MRVVRICFGVGDVAGYTRKHMGRPPSERMAIAKAFIAKAVYEITTTKGLIAYLRASPTLQRRAKKGVRAGRSDERKLLKNDWNCRQTEHWKKIWQICLAPAIRVASGTAAAKKL